MPYTTRLFMKGLIDYAGLFPPAKLPMKEAVAEYTEYENGPDQEMLGRFICPASRLKELSEFRDCFHPHRVYRFSVLADTVDDLELIHQFESSWYGMMRVEALEIKLPDSIKLKDFLPVDLPVFWEMIPFNTETLVEIAAAGKPWGVKLRCGGTEPSHFPSVEHVAEVISYTLAARRPFKATAGLHHPVRHFDTGIGVNMHGYLNVFFAVILGKALSLNLKEITTIIAEEDSDAFTFLPDGGIRFKNWQTGAEQVTQIRNTVAISYGSCSFREPVNEIIPFGNIES